MIYKKVKNQTLRAMPSAGSSVSLKIQREFVKADYIIYTYTVQLGVPEKLLI